MWLNPTADSFVDNFYGPLGFVAEKWPLFDNFGEWYVGWWMDEEFMEELGAAISGMMNNISSS